MLLRMAFFLVLQESDEQVVGWIMMENCGLCMGCMALWIQEGGAGRLPLPSHES